MTKRFSLSYHGKVKRNSIDNAMRAVQMRARAATSALSSFSEGIAYSMKVDRIGMMAVQLRASEAAGAKRTEMRYDHRFT